MPHGSPNRTLPKVMPHVVDLPDSQTSALNSPMLDIRYLDVAKNKSFLQKLK